MAMTEARKGEIALLALKSKLRGDGVRVGPHFMREIGNQAKGLGISTEEAREFMEGLVRQLVDETFPRIKFGDGK